MKSPQLKPCPFCGGKARSYVYDQRDSWHLLGVVECEGCGLQLDDNSINFSKFEEHGMATKAAELKVCSVWNTRFVESKLDF